MERAWYVFTGGDPYDVNSYYRLTFKPVYFLCGDRVCAISAPDNGTYPAHPLSENLQKYIRDGLATQMYQPDSPLGTKAYVYLRD